MRKLAAIIALGLLLPSASPAQQLPNRPLRGGGNAGQSRVALERQVFRIFVQQTAGAMRLNPAGRNRLDQILQESNARRRALVVASLDLRRRLQVAIRDSATTDPTFEGMLREAQQLRQREHDLWLRDQEELGRLLTPRQRAIFVVRWIRLQEQIQGVIDDRPGRGAAPPDTLR
ncbi:MAG: hypothetical protein ACREMQ_08395 [Longimicrobiales bacterium]